MIKKLNKNDKVAIVSLSRGLLGEPFIAHELSLGVKRLTEMGLEPVFMPNSLKDMDYLEKHPEARAEDLKTAFADPSIKMVLSAIGGNDTYRTLPYLLNDQEFINNVKNSSKIFMGFSDTTANHLMFHNLGLNTFYGPAFLPDFAELEPDMLPYTKQAVDILFNPKQTYKIESSDVWYTGRTDFSPNAVGTLNTKNTETKGYELLQGSKSVSGELLGGCLDVLDQLLLSESDKNDSERYEILSKFDIFPNITDWHGKIMFIETSDTKMSPEDYLRVIKKLKSFGVFDQINGLIVGKPADETFYEEYKTILKQELSTYSFPILANLNFGHAIPRTIIPYGATAEINPSNKTFTILKSTIC